MSVVSKSSKALMLAAAMLTVPAATGIANAQNADDVLVTGPQPPALETLGDGPDLEGIISARRGNRLQITSDDGTNTVITVSNETKIKSKGGFLGLSSDKLASDSLLNGLPVSVETKEWSGGLVASQVDLKSKDLKTAEMIRNGTNQRFAEQGAAIEQNAAATEALRGRFGDIDKYNVVSSTNVYFDTGKAVLSPEGETDLCTAASEADAMENALLLVVGYTDSTGTYEINQALSEKRAGRVVNYLQQQCGWKPYRMLTPTGMAEADPAADNSTPEGKAQNRRVSVNVLVSKAIENM